MSNIYIQEPPTHGKVCMTTTAGDIEIELWSRECPLACRNFVQLCLENYYNKTKFHRVVKDFIVQGGDPTGTGHGGESVYDKPFKDEFHSRLRFVRRGLVAMANAGKDDNGSQFFFTMGPAQELQNKHTIFGKVVGDTVYNMLRLQEGSVQDERPLHPHKVIKAAVLINPFEDIVPRQLIQMILDEEGADKSGSKKSGSKMRATKDFKLLSFGDEAEEEETDLNEISEKFKPASKSSHDLLQDPMLLTCVGEDIIPAHSSVVESKDSASDDGPPERNDAGSVRSKLSSRAKELKDRAKQSLDDEDDFSEPTKQHEMESKRKELKNQIKELKRSLKGDSGRSLAGDVESASKKPRGQVLEDGGSEDEDNDLLKAFHLEKRKYQQKVRAESAASKKGSAREDVSMSLLSKFKAKLESMTETEEDTAPAAEDNEDEVQGDSWLRHTLTFHQDDPILAKDANTKDDDWFDIYDPRNPVNKRRRERDRKQKKP